MKNWKIAPADPDVAKYIECYWFLEKGTDRQSIEYPKLYPDPCAHIVLTGADYAFKYTQDQQRFEGFGSHCIFPHLRTFLIDHTGAFLIFGIKLRIGAMYATRLVADSHEIDNIVSVTAEEVLGAAPLDSEKILVDSDAQPETVRRYLDNLLKGQLKSCRDDRHMLLTRKAIPLLAGVSVGSLGDRLSCSQRTLERSFLKVTGVTLKQCQSMIRFEQITEYLYERTGSEIDWLDVVAEFGFSDQPHLVRFLKERLSTTPSEYARHRDLTIDVYGNFETD